MSAVPKNPAVCPCLADELRVPFPNSTKIQGKHMVVILAYRWPERGLAA